MYTPVSGSQYMYPFQFDFWAIFWANLWVIFNPIELPPSAPREQVLRVESLVPYERYRFRVTWRLPEAELHSPPSRAARTKADDFGRPSPPVLESVRQERRLRVSIAWRPPAEPRGPLAFYRLSIKGVSTDVKDRAEVMMECIYSVLSLSPKGCGIFASDTPLRGTLYRYMSKSRRIGCMIPHCNLQRGITHLF